MASAIIVFSHLRWDFVFQRPQQLLTRLAKHHPIVFVEEPMYHESATFLKTTTPAPNILVCQPHTPVKMGGFHDDQLPHLQKLMRQLARDYDDHLVWFYTPMALPLLQEFDPRLVVYDCMDELAAFKNAPKQILQRENAVLKLADVVFTGGRSLYRSKRERNPNVHCFPSSVDAAHFVQALDRTNSHPAHREIPGPRLGFYGVIDERFDTDLIAKVADAHPIWQIVLVGPVVKIDPASLPQRPNIHYLGQQSYQALPQFLAGWDVCLLPFALNESTRFISPTKTLEYMAAELPIVSTPVTDVAEVYSDIVAIAPDAQAFVAACEAALLARPEEHAQTVEKMRRVLASTSWDATAESMRKILESTPHRQAGTIWMAEAPGDELANVDRLRQHEPVRYAKTVIIGAGPTGLSAAYHLGHDAVLFDKNPMVGEWCRSTKDNGFMFDYAAHSMFSNDPYVLDLYETLLGSNLHWQNLQAWIYSNKVHTRHPFHGALYGLPPEVIKECIMGAIEARYGSLKKSHASGGQANAATAVTLRASDTEGPVAPLSSNVAALEKRGPANFEEFIHQVYGAGIAKHFVIPYNRKFWGVPLTEMETSWLSAPVAPDPEQMIDGALQPAASPTGAAARFGYPLRGGFQALMSGFVPHIKGTIELNADVVQISPKQRMLVLADGRRYQYEYLISTTPLPELVNMVSDEAPEEVKQAASGLRHVSMRCVNLGIAREKITDKHWIDYPEDTIFHRVFMQGNASPECNAPGGFGLTCEISYSPTWKPLPLTGQALIERCIQDCIKVGLLREDDRIIAANEVDMPYAYVIHDHAREKNVDTLRSWFSAQDIVLAGQCGEWEYSDSDHAFIAGKKAAETVLALQRWEAPKKSAAAE
jgi:UDP-galactopyranose mutase